MSAMLGVVLVLPSWVPAAAAGASVSMTSVSLHRDATTGAMTFDVGITEDLTSTNCSTGAYTCYNYLQGLGTDGTWQTVGLDSRPTGQQSWPYSYHFTGSNQVARISAVRVEVQYSGGAVDSASVPVTDTDSPSASVVVTKWSHQGTSLAWSVKETVANYNAIDGPCPWYGYNYLGILYCPVTLYAVTDDGTRTALNTYYQSVLQGDPSPRVFSFAGTTTIGHVASLQVTMGGGSTVLSTLPAQRIYDGSTKETVGGGNASERACPCSAGDPVDTATGEFYQSASDLSLAGSGPAVTVSRTYSSSSPADGPFGFGWAASFTTRLQVVTAGDSTDPLPRLVQVVQENGAATPFSESSSQTYPSDPWVTATLTHSASTGNWTFVRDHRETFTFDSTGALVSLADPHGSSVSFGHDANGRVTSISGSGGRTVTLTWSGSHVSKLTDSAGRSVAYAYDTNSNLTSVVAVDGATWKYGYDSNHLLTTLTRPLGGVTTNTYDSSGRVVSQSDPLSRVTSFSYGAGTTTVTEPDGSQRIEQYAADALTQVTQGAGSSLQRVWTYDHDAAQNTVATTDPTGAVTTSTFDANGDPLTTTDPLGRTTTRTFDALGDVLSVTDPLGRVTSMTYDAAGDLLSTTTPGGHTSSASYNADGTVASTTDAAGKVTTVTSSAAGLPLCTTDPDSRVRCVAYNSAGFVTSSTDAAGKVTALTVDAAGRVLTSKDPLARTTTSVYDADGNRTKVTDPLGHATTSAFDAADQLTSMTDAAGKATTYSYDAAGRVTKATDPLGDATTTAYDVLGRKTSVTDALTRATTYTYDAADRVLTTTTPSGGVTTNAYDAAGELTSSTDPLGKVTSYAYDAAGRMTSMVYPGSKTVSYGYDAANELTKATDWASRATTFTYDGAGRLASTTRPDGTVVAAVYDAAGELTKADYPGTADDVAYTYNADGTRATMVDRTSTTTTTYGTTGLVTKVVNGAGTTVSYGYDAAGRMTSMVYPGSKTVAYVYDAADELTKATDWASRATTFTWSADARLATQTDANGVVDTRSYDAADQLTKIADAKGSTAVATFQYAYDAAGQLTTATINGTVRTFAHDSLGQLSTTSSGTYAASAAGLLTALASGSTQTYNAAQELTAQTPTSGPATGYAYNANGSRITSTVAASGSTAAKTSSYGYDAAANLNSVTTSAGTTVTYKSDGNGLRQTRTVGSATTKLLWDTADSLPLLLDDGTSAYVYGPGGTPIEQVNDSTAVVQYLHADNVGSVRAITSSTGAVAGTADFDAYGRVASTTGSTSAIGYTGALTDATTGLVYLRARDYDPATGQFLQVDPAIDSTGQPYAYTGNDPINATDPTGLYPVDRCPPGPTEHACLATKATQQSEGQDQPDVSKGITAGLVSYLNALSMPALRLFNPQSRGVFADLDPETYSEFLRECPNEMRWGSSVGFASSIEVALVLLRGKGIGEVVASSEREIEGLEKLGEQQASPGDGSSSSLIGAPNEFDPSTLRGLTVDEVRSRVPSDWVVSPSKTGGGEVFRDPQNPGRQLRIMPGYPAGSRPDPMTTGPYAVVSQNGVTVKVPLYGNATLP